MSVLTRIVKRAKQMKKARPNKHRKWTGYVKDASAEYKRGGFKKAKKRKAVKRKKSVSSIGKVKRKRARKPLTQVLKKLTRKRRSTRKRSVKVVKRRRVGARGGKSIMPVLAVAAIGLGAIWLLTKNKTTTPPPGGYPPLVATGNTGRDQTSQNILNYAMAAGLATDAIIKLIQALNNKSDADIQKVAQTIDAGGGIPDWIMYG